MATGRYMKLSGCRLLKSKHCNYLCLHRPVSLLLMWLECTVRRRCEAAATVQWLCVCVCECVSISDSLLEKRVFVFLPVISSGSARRKRNDLIECKF